LERIGGGFSVLTLATLFDRDSDFDRIVKEKKLWHPGDDFVLSPPSTVALRILSEIVKNPPTGGPTYNPEQDRAKIRIWKQWISENRVQITDMQPNGEGVRLTKDACREWKNRNRVFIATFLCVGCSRDLRGSFAPSKDGKTYLAVVDDNGGHCGPIKIDGKIWPHPVGHAGRINPGHHTIECGGEIGFDIRPGVLFKFTYWGP